MRTESNRDAEQAARKSNQRELDQVHHADLVLGHAQAAQHGACVQVALHEAARGDRHRDGGEHGRQQADQRQEAVRAVERGAHLRAAVLKRFDAHALDRAAGDLRTQPLFVPVHARQVVGGWRGDLHAVCHAGEIVDQVRGRQVGKREHHARGEVGDGRAAVGFGGDQLRDPQALVAELDRVADVDLQADQQVGIDPYGAGRGHGRGAGAERRAGIVGAGRDAHLAAQRVACRDRLHGSQLGDGRVALACLRHAGEGDGIGQQQAAAPGFAAPVGANRLVGVHQQVRTDQLVCVAVEGGAHAVHKKTDRRERGHGHHQRHQQETQFAGAPVAQGHSK
jgi:hypothetical protein